MKDQGSIFGDIFWYFLLVICHLLWGLFPVSCRYLQTKAKPPLEPMRLGFYVAALAAIGLLFTYTLPVCLLQCCCKKIAGQDRSQVNIDTPARCKYAVISALSIINSLQFAGVLLSCDLEEETLFL